jgi:hypothetical protein
MARSRKIALRKNPSSLVLVLVAGAVVSLAGGAWWFLKNRNSLSFARKGKVGFDKSVVQNLRSTPKLALLKGGGGTIASLSSNTERAEKARARRDRILAERAAGSEPSEELDLEGQPLDTSLPVG